MDGISTGNSRRDAGFSRRRGSLGVAGALLSVALVAASQASQLQASASGPIALSFSGRIDAILLDSGQHTLAGTAVGSSISGNFSYPNTTAGADTLEPNEADYEFATPPASASFELVNVAVTANSGLAVNIQNDHPVDAEEAAILSTITGRAIAVGTPVDVWTVSGIANGSFNSDDDLVGGPYIEVGLISLDTTLYDSLDYRPLPPPINAVSAAVFVVAEGNSAGTIQFLARGSVTALARRALLQRHHRGVTPTQRPRR